MRFSQRHGYKPVRDRLQLESMDSELRNALWSLLKLHAWDNARASSGTSTRYLSSDSNEELYWLATRLWFAYFKLPLDNLSYDWSKVLKELREYYFKCQWFEVYDFVEFVAANYKAQDFRKHFIGACNAALEREMSAYRFVGGIIAPITDQHELNEIDQAVVAEHDAVRTHLRRSLELLADRAAPDYRNSIKESISAVESLVARYAKQNKGTLGQLIKQLEAQSALHPSVGKAFSHLYGYTSDEGGIRHALMEAETVTFGDAKFMLVVCSAFVNFVNGKHAG